eukprot:TRINITY_DN15905_c0_g1_i1.p1 TRINITY_DN15905_c0_g1~~TRINITY_DN15905_c0_g1_i1.p1  ORF type:complete len:392 (+),score=37.82 TRINITY_DN15905_c0_g1_i1:87-1262(+)
MSVWGTVIVYLVVLVEVTKSITITGLSGGSCTSGTSTDLTDCSPDSTGSVLTISGSSFYSHDPSGNTIAFTSGWGTPPVCYPLWTSLSTTNILCNLYVFGGDVSGNWSVFVTASSATTVDDVRITVLPPKPVITSGSCSSTSCTTGDTITVSGSFLKEAALTFSKSTSPARVPTCAGLSSSNTSLTCTLYVPPGYSDTYTVTAYPNYGTSMVSTTSFTQLVYNKAPVIDKLDASFCTVTGSYLAGCTAVGSAGEYITIIGENFAAGEPSLHTVSFARDTSHGGIFGLNVSITPTCTPVNATERLLSCFLEVYHTGVFYMSLTVGSVSSSSTPLLYLEAEAPSVTNVTEIASGQYCYSTNLSYACENGATLVIAGDNFVPYSSADNDLTGML